MKMIKNEKAKYELAIMILAGHGLSVRELENFYDVEFETYEVPEYRMVLTPVDEVMRQIGKFLTREKNSFFAVEDRSLRMETNSGYLDYIELEIK